MAQIEVSASIGALVIAAAASQGVSLPFDLSSDPDAKIPIEREQELWDEAARLTRDEAFGLRAAQLLKPGAFGVLDYAIRTASTLRSAIERVIRYNRLVHDTAEFALIERADVARVEHRFRASNVAQSRHGAEFTLASVLVVGGQITATVLRPRAVAFRHGRPSPTALGALAQFFGVEPKFAAPANTLELERSDLDLPCPSADPALGRVIEQHAEALLAARPPLTHSIADRVRSALALVLSNSDAPLASVAAKLKMSKRTLQRKLSEESLTFETLLDDYRRDLALRYLADPRLAISEIAYLLGFSEPSPFHRAFKRWTGVTPSQARQRAG